jgi:hypothetical protein
MVVFFKCNVPGLWMESPGQHVGNPAGIYLAIGAPLQNFYI